MEKIKKKIIDNKKQEIKQIKLKRHKYIKKIINL